MGIYLNSHSAYGLFCRDCASTYFVDKSDILKDLIPLVEMDNDELNDTDLAQKKGSEICLYHKTTKIWQNCHS